MPLNYATLAVSPTYKTGLTLEILPLTTQEFQMYRICCNNNF